MLSARDCSCVLATSRLYSATLSRCWFSLICCCTVVSWLVAWLYFSTARSASWYTPCSFAWTSRSRVFLSATGEAEAWVERAKERRRVPRRGDTLTELKYETLTPAVCPDNLRRRCSPRFSPPRRRWRRSSSSWCCTRSCPCGRSRPSEPSVAADAPHRAGGGGPWPHALERFDEGLVALVLAPVVDDHHAPPVEEQLLGELEGEDVA